MLISLKVLKNFNKNTIDFYRKVNNKQFIDKLTINYIWSKSTGISRRIIPLKWQYKDSWKTAKSLHILFILLRFMFWRACMQEGG